MNTLEITIDITALTAMKRSAAAIREYTTSGERYKVRLQLDQNGNCSLRRVHPAKANCTPESVWNGRTQEWNVPLDIGHSALQKLLTSPEVLELLQRCYEGHDVEWDGHNHRGSLDEDAQRASGRLEQLLEYTARAI